MYIGKHTAPKNDGGDGHTHSIQLPQNYAGNAFSPRCEDNDLDIREPKDAPCETEARNLPLCLEAPKEKYGLFAKVDRLFSSDTLLILLAILLAGSEDGGELAVILLLLLLF